ncbi:unnamed protein product [Caenorhabditis bovis]|uniref:Dienelactone hydrolase domain-containing protein n=1 Tax=Caenorhabditis bovis TaxID=2654633 RepID=A0A8S1ERI6_9PELO|nr:unnamed protein product [Caenorhabditis bovis]
MTVIHKVVEYKTNDSAIFEGDLYIPSGARKLGAVLVFPAFRGITHFEKEQAEKLANLGYIAFCADVYGKNIRPQTVEEAFATMNAIKNDRQGVLKSRMMAALETLKRVKAVDPNRIAAIGYCFGGLCALDMARYNVGLKAAVSYHGTLLPIDGLPLDPIATAVQIHHGDADPHVGQEQVVGIHEEMRKRNADFVFVSHGNAMHAFTEPEADLLQRAGVGYNAKAAKRSWEMTLNLLDEVFV